MAAAAAVASITATSFFIETPNARRSADHGQYSAQSEIVASSTKFRPSLLTPGAAGTAMGSAISQDGAAPLPDRCPLLAQSGHSRAAPPAGLKCIMIWFAVGSLLGFMGHASKITFSYKSRCVPSFSANIFETHKYAARIARSKRR